MNMVNPEIISQDGTGENRTKITRRDFLKQVGLGAVAVGSDDVGKMFGKLAAGFRLGEVKRTEADHILEVTHVTQAHALSCEFAVTAMGASLFKRPPSGEASWEEPLIMRVSKSHDPYKGFVGNIEGNQAYRMDSPGYGYGVYPPPLMKALKEIGIASRMEVGIGAKGHKAIVEAVRNDQPVVMWGFHPNYYKPFDKSMVKEVGGITFIEGEHAFCVRGVSADGSKLFINNPSPVGIKEFWAENVPGWDLFNGMRLVIEGPLRVGPRTIHGGEVIPP